MSADDVEGEPAAAVPAGLAVLRSMWQEALADPNLTVDPSIDELVRCQVVSIRYALLTQLLGKVVDESRDALSIQRGEATTADESGRWDARSFCSLNVVPWVNESGQVLGTSPDPYVNNPLRRPRLDSGYELLRYRSLWESLAKQLHEVENRDSPEFAESKLRSSLASLVAMYRELTVEFDVPQRISLEAASKLVSDFLQEPSGGERAQIVTAALMRTIGDRFGIFDCVIRQAINEADAARSRPGDVVCLYQNVQVLAVEVKDRTIELHDVETSIGKARRNSVKEILFATTDAPVDEPSIADRTTREFNLGINVYRMGIDALLRVALSIGGELSRTEFLTRVGEELNDRVTQPAHKQAWTALLQNL